jgi:hypothetical protein
MVACWPCRQIESRLTRWAKRLLPAVLQRLMRHASIQMSMAYYVALEAADVADSLWSAWGASDAGTLDSGNTFGDNGW